MTSLIFSIYLILVLIWFLFSLLVVTFTLRYHLFSVTNWVMIALYIIIALQIFTVTATSLSKYTPSQKLFPFVKQRTYEYHLSQ